MIWKTRITEITGIRYPLLMGAFGGWGKSEFASIFSNLGGLGVIPAMNFPKFEDFREDLRKMKQLTKNPFSVNLSLPHGGFNIQEKKTRTKADYLKYVEIALDEGVKIFTTSGYKAGFLEQKIHAGGALWFHKCVLIKHALSAEKVGADAVTIVGLEGTGFKHPNTNTTLVNMTMARKLLKIPIIAAGGIGDARGFLAALFSGADAVCLGTALMAAEECPAPEKAKKKWTNIDIFNEDFYETIFHYNIKHFMAPSMAIGHQRKILPMKDIIDNIIKGAKEILLSVGFNSNSFSLI